MIAKVEPILDLHTAPVCAQRHHQELNIHCKGEVRLIPHMHFDILKTLCEIKKIYIRRSQVWWISMWRWQHEQLNTINVTHREPVLSCLPSVWRTSISIIAASRYFCTLRMTLMATYSWTSRSQHSNTCPKVPACTSPIHLIPYSLITQTFTIYSI